MKVHFKDVGRDKKTWSAECPENEQDDPWDWMYRQIRARGSVMSRDIDFYQTDESSGKIVVGAVRVIGTYSIERVSAESLGVLADAKDRVVGVDDGCAADRV